MQDREHASFPNHYEKFVILGEQDVCRLPEGGSKWNRRSFSRVSAAKRNPRLAKGGYDFARFEKTTLKVSDFPENQNQVIFVRSIQTLRYA
jgi:hypothetical protein